MSAFEHERAALARLRRQPWLLLAGAALLGVLALAYGAGWAVANPFGITGYAWIVGPVPVAGVVALLVPFPLAAVYEVALGGEGTGESRSEVGDPGARWPLGRMLVGAAETYARLLTTTVASSLVGLVVGAGILVALLAVDAFVDYARYATGAPRTPPMEAELAAFAWLVVASAALTQLLLAFQDLAVVDGQRRPVEGWQAALQFAWARPRALVRYGVGRVLLLSPGPVLVWLGAEAWQRVDPTWLAFQPDWLGPALFVSLFSAGTFLAVASLALAALYHVEVYEREVAPALSATTPPSLDGLSTGRARVLALATVVVVAAVAGGVALRVTDTRPGTAVATGAVGDDPAAIAGNARHHLRNGSYEVHVRRTETDPSADEWRETWNGTLAVDRERRRLRFESSSRLLLPFNWTRTDHAVVYASDASLGAAPTGPYRDPRPEQLLANHHADRWTVTAWPGYTIWTDRSPLGVPIPVDDRWQVVERDGGTVTLAWHNRTPAPPNVSGDYRTDRRITLTVDAETGRPRRVVETTTEVVYHDNGTVAERWTTRERAVYRRFGDVEVRRPAAVGSRTPMEWFWEVVYY